MESNERIRRLERQVRALVVGLVIIVAAFAVVSLRAQPENLRVRQITVVDEKGTERVWIGAPVPDPIHQGKRVKRKGPVSGVILLDAKGNERGGYVTDPAGGVFMSLDSERGQEALFYMNPGGGGHISIYDADRNMTRIGVLQGRPTLILQEKGQVVFEQPITKK